MNKIYKKLEILETLNEENLEYNFHNKDIQTGDIVLFTSHTGIISKIINFWTKSQYVHIGIVIRDVVSFLNNNNNFKIKTNIKLDDSEFGLLECGYENYKDMDNKKYKYGVQITSLKNKIKNYPGKAYLRKLDISCNPSFNNLEINNNIYNIYESIKNKPYDLNLNDLFYLKKYFLNENINNDDKEVLSINNDISDDLSDDNDKTYQALKNWFKHDNQKMDKFICSSLVAFIYTKLKFLPLDTPWTQICPSYFSCDNKNLKFINLIRLEKEIELN